MQCLAERLDPLLGPCGIRKVGKHESAVAGSCLHLHTHRKRRKCGSNIEVQLVIVTRFSHLAMFSLSQKRLIVSWAARPLSAPATKLGLMSRLDGWAAAVAVCSLQRLERRDQVTRLVRDHSQYCSYSIGYQ
ncbi:hypothetical protein J6590_005473 [Homalodisca vitripennis]|nr:hypothetical protein J6590_005473 [Homalodisca vitripennis]